MSRNPLVDAAADVITAFHALRTSRSALVHGDGDGGLVIEEPRKPRMILTHENARQFCQGRREAEHA